MKLIVSNWVSNKVFTYYYKHFSGHDTWLFYYVMFACDLKKTEAAVITAILIQENATQRVKYELLHFRTHQYQ